MKLRPKDYLTIAGFAAWGAGIGWSIKAGYDMLKKEIQLTKIEHTKAQTVINNIKDEIKENFPELDDKQMKKLERACEMNQTAPAKVLNWQRVADSLMVQKIGTEALQEFNSKVAPKLYNDTVKALKTIK